MANQYAQTIKDIVKSRKLTSNFIDGILDEDKEASDNQSKRSLNTRNHLKLSGLSSNNLGKSLNQSKVSKLFVKLKESPKKKPELSPKINQTNQML